MPGIKHRGLSGRSRQVRERNRAERLFTQQLIDESLMADPDEPERYIPIRGRSEFLPTAATGVAGDGPALGTQLELPLDGEPASQVSSDAPPSSDPAAPSAFDEPVRPHGQRASTERPTRRDDHGLRIIHERLALKGHARRRLTLRGFLYGCVLGSSAAAMILLVLQIVL